MTSIIELDGKFWKSFKYLVARPGVLTRDYLLGRRIGVLSPFRILLTSKIFYFLMISIFAQSILTTPLRTHVTAYNFLHQPLAKKMVDERIKDRSSSFETIEGKFDEMSEKQAKTLTFIMVPLLFVFVTVLMHFFGGDGLKNLIFATHFVCFMLIVLALVVPVIHVGLKLLVQHGAVHLQAGHRELLFSSILFFIYGLYFYFAIKCVYSLEWKRAFILSILLAFSVYWVFILYRMLLFFTTFSVI
ncbi:DUF3667 domain-containing protein [Marinicella sp. W31]|uniref:DUF3667 domain-containing protein n=1 Tax=Marinicella sp. W31 TaxID=3023713 RepID=UPI003757A97D